MMKNRAGWLALVVLGIATVLMIFFVLPRVTGDRQAAEQAASDPQQPAKDTAAKAPDAAPTATDTAAKAVNEVSAKMARLAAEAEKAVTDLSTLFADGKTPTAEAYAGARALATSAVSALSALEIPEGLDAAVMEAARKTREAATRTLTLLQSLPDSPQEAAAAISTILKALKGETITADVPAAPASQPSADVPAAADDAALPRFDVLRVEPDGSTVIAGSAAPGSKLEIIDGDKPISTIEVGPSGDFAAVIDQPLAPGDHTLELKATAKDGKTVTSEEVATVSIPEKSGGELLAMVTKPGEASRLISVPETVNTADKTTRVAADQPADAAAITPALPAASSVLATAPPATGTEPANAPTTLPADASQKPEIQVTAVELEGDRIFVAGTAAAGRSVKAYADDQMIGQTIVDQSGHFVVDGKMALTVGQHVIRVDLLGADGKVALRASVPFDRPAGDQVAVIAQPNDTTADAAGTMIPLEQGAFAKQRDALAKAFSILKSLYADGKQPALESLAAARSATEIALKSLAEFRLGNDADQAQEDFVMRIAGKAATALTTLQALPRDIAAVGAALDKLSSLIDAVLEPLPQPAAPADQTAQAGTPAAPPSAPAPVVAGAPKTIEQAPLTESRNTVIIRRGDTLWQISRRVYGQGVRYTTIYLANEDQIANPDLIEPGQTFKVPNEALPNAEELHRKRLQERRSN
ncbi:LysM peptidoglycan-binding domain-containing protein [Agrobacterium sp. a22-2]|uniref:LysM peptidoglycan-binding domain-containing protein n=1 Tax=Agrobacterium sp. a22-2 TaxID=2283840 RepID=UPI0014481EA7|nr:LysM peptidoglycan-binding domain-containing protein [Agrobacterium sp. a22-2]NKN37968.1 LysM peptidoglycan-binding domain-containing protein [Agrobacterium sp. a22-2]